MDIEKNYRTQSEQHRLNSIKKFGKIQTDAFHETDSTVGETSKKDD